MSDLRPRGRRARVAGALALACAAMAGCGGASERAAPQRAVPFRLVNDRIVVAAKLNGRTLPMLLDTAGRTTISPAAAHRLGASTQGGAASLSSLELGGLRRTNVAVRVEPARDTGRDCASPNGTIGADVLRGAALQIDYDAGVIDAAGDAADMDVRDAVRVPFAVGPGGAPLVRARVASTTARLALDTGMPRYMALEPGLARRAGVRAGSRSLAFAGAHGAEVRFGGLGAIRVGGITRRGVVVATGGAAAGTSALGTAFLRDFVVTLDWTTRTAHLFPLGQGGTGRFRTYGYLPGPTAGGAAAAAVMANGPAGSLGMEPGDRITRAGGRSLAGASRTTLCAAYAEAFAPTHDVQGVAWRRAGRARRADLAAVEVGPEAPRGAPARPRDEPRPGARPGPGRGGEPTVLVDGDSLSVGARPYLEQFLRGWEIDHSAHTGRPTGAGLAILRERAQAGLPRVIVMALGTNDDSRATDAFRAAIREALELAGPRRCVVWPTIVRPPFRGVSYDGFNAVLASEARRHDNLIVVDWEAKVRARPEWLAPDGTHLTPAGYRARAREIARAVGSC